MMINKIQSLLEEINSIKITTSGDLELFRLKYLSKRGLITEMFEEFRNIPAEQKRNVGQKLNELKQSIQDKYNTLRKELGTGEDTVIENDLTKPAFPYPSGSRHPISIVRKEIIDIFQNRLCCVRT
jgi:phenylalanyl-tRNA synthetase alpha chain